jgi:hypothetical protein
MIGEDSLEKADVNTVCMLDRLMDDAIEEDGFMDFQRFAYSKDDGTVVIPAGMDGKYSPIALMTMLLGRVKRNVLLTAERLGYTSSSSSDGLDVEFVFAVPSSYSIETRHALMDAAYAANVDCSRCVDSNLALGRVLQQRKFSEGEKKVMIVEMGHARTNITVVKIHNDGDDHREEKEESNHDCVTVLANVHSSVLGAGSIDICLYNHFMATHPSLVGASFDTKSRSAQRLLEGCKKLKHLLSMLSEGSVVVETIGKNESDVTLSASRELLAGLCQDSVTMQFKSMMEQCIQNAGGVQVLDDIASVELTGGGSRIPLVQDTILECLRKKGDESFSFSKSLDDTSLALGAAMMGGMSCAPVDDVLDNISDERKALRESLRNNEVIMAEKDAELVKKDELKNQIESHILELRSARHGKHGSLLPDSEEFTAYLDGTDDWIFSEECDDATLDAMSKKWQEVQSKSEELCAEYLNAKKLEAERVDREMEEEAKRAAAEAAMNGEDVEDDHDNRKLPTKRRMEIVMKNKAEVSLLSTCCAAFNIVSVMS